jgi:hypothetical protein
VRSGGHSIQFVCLQGTKTFAYQTCGQGKLLRIPLSLNVQRPMPRDGLGYH